MNQPSQNNVSGLVEAIAQFTEHLSKKFDIRNLSKVRAFYQAFPIRGALRTELGWMYNHALSHIAPERTNATAQLAAREKGDE